jgi:hypothetical protein
VDFIKGKCTRETCKYFHPPEHLVSQLKKQKSANSAAAAKAAAIAAASANATLAISPNQLLSQQHFSAYNPMPAYHQQLHLNTAYQPANHQQNSGTSPSSQQYHIISPNSGIQYANTSHILSTTNGINHTHHSTAAAYLNSQSAQLAAIAAANTNLV